MAAGRESGVVASTDALFERSAAMREGAACC